MNKYAIFSTTIDPTYDFFIPIVSRAWKSAGITPICYIPTSNSPIVELIQSYSRAWFIRFDGTEEQLPTYSQNIRTYCGTLQVEDDSVLILSDADMLICNPSYFQQLDGNIHVFGADLTPDNQYPVCYTSMSRKLWNELFECGDLTPQQMLDKNLGHIQCENMRGNYWCHEQENLRKIISQHPHTIHNRAYEGTQFSSKRIDRTDTNWAAYLQPDTIDCHIWRRGFDHIDKIMQVLQYFYPSEDHSWVYEYTNEYLKIIQL